MMKTVKYLAIIISGCLSLAACTQSTPSMMNSSKPELVMQTDIEQVPAEQVTDVYLTVLAEDYRRYGDGSLDLTMAYDPKSKTYTAMKALHQLSEIKEKLKKKGIYNVTTNTIQVPDGQPALMVAFDSVKAQGPSDCGTMPGLENYKTTREVGDYKFGCAVESMMAKQIYRPADLRGNDGGIVSGDGRRASNVIEQYRNYSSEDAEAEIETLEREDLQAE